MWPFAAAVEAAAAAALVVDVERVGTGALKTGGAGATVTVALVAVVARVAGRSSSSDSLEDASLMKKEGLEERAAEVVAAVAAATTVEVLEMTEHRAVVCGGASRAIFSTLFVAVAPAALPAAAVVGGDEKISETKLESEPSARGGEPATAVVERYHNLKYKKFQNKSYKKHRYLQLKFSRRRPFSTLSLTLVKSFHRSRS